MGKIILVNKMEEKKTSSLNLFIIFFLSYSFYITQILTQELFYSFGKECVLIICIMQILFPLAIYLICKVINRKAKKENEKNNFIFSLITGIYLMITSIICLVNITNIIILYYYQQTSFIILLIVMALPIIYTIIKGDTNFFHLSAILLIIYVIFKYTYLGNNSKIDIYVFSDILKIKKSNILLIIIYSIPILLEPLILLNNRKMIKDKINIKTITIFAFLISLVGIFTVLRQTWEFGNLLNKIRFPYLESIKNIIAGDFFENIDFYYLLSIATSIYIRLSYSFITIKRIFSLNNLITLGLILLTLIITYFLKQSMSLYIFSIDKILIISSTCLLMGLILLPLITIRRKRNHG